MIHTSKQLKDKVRNISKGDNNIAKMLIRNFMMERFLERVSVSDYRDQIILKGGMLVAAIVGVDMRATMDIDATVKAFPVNADDAQRMISEICAIPLGDGVCFHITSVSDIMTDMKL
ncbi:MAG: nucleotidyl transferase AbiEii/AbiGii toxin family protein [Butyrivibrio sp.]|nr:nucleotidyl transferase AbiEii/AbiGii toxin family protein [Butyrivibrio sp.]